MNMKKLTLIIAGAGIATSLWFPAAADEFTAPRTETVRYADLDVTHAPGAAELFQRVKSAAERVCADPGRSLAAQAHHSACMRSAVSGAVTQIDEPAVSAYAARHGVFPYPATLKVAQGK
jgi:UrcA family protein